MVTTQMQQVNASTNATYLAKLVLRQTLLFACPAFQDHGFLLILVFRKLLVIATVAAETAGKEITMYLLVEAVYNAQL